MKPVASQRHKLDYLFLFGSLGLGLVTALVVIALAGYASANRQIDHAFQMKELADEWLTSVMESQSAAGALSTTTRPELLQAYQSSYRAWGHRAAAQLEALLRLAASNAEQTQNIRAAARAAQAALVSGARDGRQSDELRTGVGRIQALEQRMLREQHARADRRGATAGMAALLLSLASSLLLGLAYSLRRTRTRMLEGAAQINRRHLEALSELATALSTSRTCAEVSTIVLDHCMQALDADLGALYLIDEKEEWLQLIGDSGAARPVPEEIRRVPLTKGGSALASAIRSGQALWVEEPGAYKALFAALTSMKASQPPARAFWCVPLVAERRTVGLLAMGLLDRRSFDEEVRVFAETVVRHCAQALLRALRLEGEDEARRWLTTTLVSIGDGVITTDAMGDVTFMNPVAEAMTGWTLAEAQGRGLEQVFAIYSEETHRPAENPAARVLRDGRVVGLANHTVLRARNGFETPIDDSGAPIRGEDGRMLGAVLVFRDATREKRERDRRELLSRTGEALVSSSLDYAGTVATVARLAVPLIADWCSVDLSEDANHAPYQAAVAHVDPGKVELARQLGQHYPTNPAARTGAPEVARSGKAELYPEISARLLENAAYDDEHLRLLRLLQFRSAIVVPLRGRTRILGAMTFVYAESGRRYNHDDLAFAQSFADRAAMAIENAIALRQIEEARIEERRLRAQSEMASRAKDEFLAMVSHELRTPLNAILGWAVTLRRRALEPAIDRGLSVIERNARTQAKLIEDVLDISRIISGKLALSLGPTNIAEAVSASVETVTPAAEAKAIDIEMAPVDPTLVITADPNRVQQIIWNLLSNAVKFTPKGGKVHVSAWREGSEVRLCVKDSGEGIRREVLPLIFEPFHQADASITRRHGGLGLGLAIAKQLIAAHGGTVRADSEGPGKGATFLVQLPARSAVAAVMRTPPTTKPRVDKPSAGPGGPRLDGLCLLIVDDERDARALVGEVLREQGADVHLADSAAAALEQLGKVRPHVIISDIGMPEMDGYALIRCIRALPPGLGGSIPAVALTAYARSEDAQRALAAGFQMFVPKPVEPTDLAVAVADLARAARSGRSPGERL